MIQTSRRFTASPTHLGRTHIKLLDFEFSCLNHRAFDFSNLFAETVMKHKQPDYPYFCIAAPEFGDRELAILINFYLDNATFATDKAQDREFQTLLQETKEMLMLSDYMYAMTALPLAIEPIQKIRFIPYAHARFFKFLDGIFSKKRERREPQRNRREPQRFFEGFSGTLPRNIEKIPWMRMMG